MNVQQLRAKNYRSYEEVDIELPSGCCAIVGENGSGKSSLVEIIPLALFGPADARSLAPYLREDTFDEEMFVEATISHCDQVFRVRRSYSPRGRGSAKLDFERAVYEPDAVADTYVGWESLTRENASATQQLITETFGLSQETFLASAFLSQGRGAMFTEAQPRERKAILAEVLQLDVWDRLLDRARIERREIETGLERLTGRIEIAEHELEQRQVVIAERDAHALEQSLARTELEQAQGAAADVSDRLSEAKEREAARASAEQLVKAKQEALQTASRLRDDLSTERDRIGADLERKPDLVEAAKKIEHLEHEAVLARRAEAVRKEHERLVLERNRLLADANDLNEQAAGRRANAQMMRDADISKASCELCGQSLGEEERQRVIAAWEREADEFDARAKELDEAAQAVPVSAAADRVAEIEGARLLTAVETELATARKASEQLAILAEREKRLEVVNGKLDELRAGLPTLERERDQAAAELDRLSDGPRVELLEREQQAAQHRIVQAQQKLSALDQAVARCDERLERLAKLETELAEVREQIASKRTEIDLLALAEKAYGRNGIPALIVENAAIPQIELEASRILAELGTPFTVELRTQRALKSGEGVRDTLDIVICSPAGERPYETFSGGERTRLNLALRIALARLLAHRRGAESRLLAIDEPEFLDESGVQRLAEVLSGLSGDFDRVLLISHVPTLATAFDQTLAVVKEGERSRVVDGTEALAADTRAEVAA